MKNQPLIFLAGILSACTSTPTTPPPLQEPPVSPPTTQQPGILEKNQQMLLALKNALNSCKRIDIRHINHTAAPHTHRCTATEMQTMRRLFSGLQALPFEGNIHALPGSWYVLTFYDTSGEQIAILRDWEITHENAAANADYCEAKATMYLRADDYAEFEQVLQHIAD
ncbi:MAG: hypothetical protein IKZ10_07150 [Akkermansia sp.]|nr:hypothetical protein [Akkermansia sp.]